MNCNAHKPRKLMGLPAVWASNPVWLRGVDLNHRPLGYEPNELPDCSTPHKNHNSAVERGQTSHRLFTSGDGSRSIGSALRSHV